MGEGMKRAIAAAKATRVKRKTVCNGCKFAEWKRTENGHLHPDASGRCMWSVEIPLPPSASTRGFGRDFKDGVLTISGQYIWRADNGNMLSECLVREPVE